MNLVVDILTALIGPLLIGLWVFLFDRPTDESRENDRRQLESDTESMASYAELRRSYSDEEMDEMEAEIRARLDDVLVRVRTAEKESGQ